jgi:hypothetical protein
MHLLQHFSFPGGIHMIFHNLLGVKASVKHGLKLWTIEGIIFKVCIDYN